MSTRFHIYSYFVYLFCTVASDVVETVTFETETETWLKFRDETETETLS